ncbi:cobyric acid synthase [Acinetobacter sp. S40]|uniref:cobyric acid synthase n=1 Tax=Acinetobacter sp. S40 TaxID=2767434 RepID=UPI00190E0B19|nr:cobyric acid synthase [Acinetobacter sp. S40]MBJ9985453.1 cobyric acid synthase [Acinetobacter sp. S40]
MRHISIFGTSSDAGKSTLTFVIAKILQDAGVRVAPFKAQNVSNNARVCDDGSEIAIAQSFQAEVLGIPTSYHLNPILLKSGANGRASVIVEGKVISQQHVLEYYRDLDQLKPAVQRCFEYLAEHYDCVVAEGAGSPVELNLIDKDLSNLFIAETYRTKIILVADIEKGGVFASVWGTYNLLPAHLRDSVIGVIINKFRGDLSLFDEGIHIIQEKFKIPVLGVLPYMPFNLGFEDNASLQNFVQQPSQKKITIGIIAYPYMSNYNDFEPLIADDEVLLEFINSPISLERFDLVILPGSKLVIQDLNWLKQNGLFEQLQQRKKAIFAICGGYEMLFQNLNDPEQVETPQPTTAEGLGFIDDDIEFIKDKILAKKIYTIFDMPIEGFEMHHGVSKKYPLYFQHEHIQGSFIHQIFDHNAFRSKYLRSISIDYQGFDFQRYKTEKIKDFVEQCRQRLNIHLILDAIQV